MLYACGSNGRGQLGCGHTNDVSSLSCVQVHRKSSVAQIAAGGNHTLVLFSDGEVYSCGDDGAEQAVVREMWDIPPHRLRRANIPPRVEHGTCINVAQVAATWSASIYLYDDGMLISVGEGTSGELGLGEKVTKVSQPMIIPTFLPQNVKFVQIASSMAHTVAVTSDGQVWGWGRGRKGQLGEPAQDVWQPRKIEGISSRVVKAVCGKDFTCLIGSRSTGEVAVLGPNRGDRFGVKTCAPDFVPDWKDIVASWGSVYILTYHGDVVAWGRNDHGQLPSTGLPPIESLDAGSEHCLALTKTGVVLVWGWGEHGNCGGLTDNDGDVKARYNRLDVKTEAIAVFAGCATSFVVTKNPEQ
nr:rcc1 repeat-containing protein c10f6.04 [Quercus suber]